LEVKVGDRVRCNYKKQVLFGVVEELMYLGRMTARVITEEGARITLPTKELRVLKEKR
tara:strand:- start:236 stop:409 length:174 start_codon:yes stop_codon:yes gene_type:complete